MKPPGSIDRDFCNQKLTAVIGVVKRLLADDYPHKDSPRALKKILIFYEGEQTLLNSLDATASLDTVLEFCRRINVNIVLLKPFLGLLLRSSNLRNAFEIYFPVKVLASELLGADARVILSSEWEFSPFTYPSALRELPEFVFIGVPASECHNPLIVPLSAHELGHVVWMRKGAKAEFDPLIMSAILSIYRARWPEVQRQFGKELDINKIETDLFIRSIWAQSYEIAQRQLEEVFCDLLGVYIFGQSFLYSFRYLVAPSLGQFRSIYYPQAKKRAEYMENAAISYGWSKIPEFIDAFNAQDISLPPADRFMIGVADAATDQLHSRLPAIVNKYADKAEHSKPGSSQQAQIEANLRSLVPCALVSSIGAIVNAAWDIRLNIDDWDILDDIENQSGRRTEKLRVLRDLVLKSFEVYEFSKRREKDAAER